MTQNKSTTRSTLLRRSSTITILDLMDVIRSTCTIRGSSSAGRVVVVVHV
jgi:hypothetical protein